MGGKNQFYLNWISVSWREFYFEGRRRTFLAMSIERLAVKDLSFFECLTMTSLFLMGNTPTFPVSCAEKRSIVSCDEKTTSQQGFRLLREIEKILRSLQEILISCLSWHFDFVQFLHFNMRVNWAQLKFFGCHKFAFSCQLEQF